MKETEWNDSYRSPFIGVVFRRKVSKTFDLQHPGRMQDLRQLLVAHTDLSVVHEPQQRLHVAVLDVPQYDDGMLARIRLFNNKIISECPLHFLSVN